jgi:CheY-like chemotaxis protein
MNNIINDRATSLALVVDDDLSLRLSMCAALAKAGFKTIEAENGHQAIDFFQSNRPDLFCSMLSCRIWTTLKRAELYGNSVAENILKS